VVRARTSRIGTLAGNRAAARAEAARLLPLARVPKGAVRLVRPPRSLSHPVVGPLSASTLVDKAETWRVALPFGAAEAWLSAHRPKGLPSDGAGSTGSTLTGQTDTVGNSYRGPAGPAWQTADLEISAAPDGAHATVIRADAMIVWLDPRPVRSGPGSHPLRVTLAGGCPSTDNDATGVSNPGLGLTARLLPKGQPSAGLRCRYGLNGPVAAQRLTAAQARRTARMMNAIPLAHPDGEAISCPLDNGSAEVLVLAYPGQPDVDLWIKLTGCGGVSNGHISAGGA
jgi:hypothetical protein